MPVWLSCVLLLLVSQPMGFGKFLDNGEFAIYSAAALSAIFYPLSKQGSGQERTFYLLLVLICLISAAGIFSGLTVASSLTIGDLHINVGFLRVASITIYVFSLVAMFFVELHENVYSEINIPEERSLRQNRLEDEFDQEYK